MVPDPPSSPPPADDPASAGKSSAAEPKPTTKAAAKKDAAPKDAPKKTAPSPVSLIPQPPPWYRTLRADPPAHLRLALGAALILLAEWWVYHRRVGI